MMPFHGPFSFSVAGDHAGERLDNVVALQVAGCSRSMAANFIREGQIRVRNEIKKPGYRVKTGDIISGRIPAPEPISCQPEAISLCVLHEDDHIVVISKPAGMVVHPAPGHFSGTLVNAILYHCPKLEGIGGKIRPGIVHRLDKDTSGILVVAKTAAAQAHLGAQFKDRTLQKTYLALVSGRMKTLSGVIDLPIGRHPVDRKKMSVLSKRNRDARTLWRVKELFDTASFLEVEIKTGRTHQIRVHCASMQHPILGDSVYGYRNSGVYHPDVLKTVIRQMLHAWRIVFTHPATGE
ncbi:MAG: RluA family pseudouridine synthase, partial [Desulfatirhabdiaceae bacterium]|nr:RluA family pseudouridine synthase [Desulfatirhabdiaceae bacterium]